MKTHSEYLVAAAEAARLFPDPSREIGPADFQWLTYNLFELGANPVTLLQCYTAIRLVLFGSTQGYITGWLGEATVGEMIRTLEAAACEVV